MVKRYTLVGDEKENGKWNKAKNERMAISKLKKKGTKTREDVEIASVFCVCVVM